MQKIFVLDDAIVNKIRAGEVVQRPLNVVKELLENSLDSGATDIRIKIEGGGKRAIEIADNGCGMSAEDAATCALRHATSKVRTMSDLEAISTLGFRGEALHALAEVSIFELRTKEKDSDVGTFVSNMGGKIITKPIGCSEGTYISAKALFFNTPARKAALKADAVESAAITKLVGRYMMLYPQIGFSYSVNGKVHVVQRVGMSEESVISAILGPDVAREMSKVDCEVGGVHVRGFMGSSRATKRTAEGIVLSINGRYIEDIDQYVKIIKDGYRRSIQRHDFPCVVLRITIDPAKVDPNIHPQKSAVDILDPELFKRALFESVLSCQRGFRENYLHPIDPLENDSPLVVDRCDVGVTNVFEDGAEEGLGKIDQSPQESLPEFSQSDTAKNEPTYSLPELEVLGQYKKTYILASSSEHFFVIDQHALHEKILYEELYDRAVLESERPPYPFILNLNPEDSDVLDSSYQLFAPYGLEIERLDATSWKCYRVPTLNGVAIPESEIIDLIKTTIGRLSNEPSLEDFKAKVLAEVACKSAIRANETLSHAEMSRMLERGRHMKDAYYCPHGRPAVKVYRERTVDQWFKR